MSDITSETPPPPPDDSVQTILLEDEMKSSYLDYAMSVIVSRALPDVRDGLKPVHRRILYAMKDGGYTNDKPFRKSARIVGDVMGKYHPHGDGAIYDAMVRMAQDFSMRLPLVDKQGNFGSMDGDPPAAMRYTEARLAKVAAEGLLKDIDRDTVDYRPNYDESMKEPSVLPAEYPNLLVNGAGGIAVGMATNIPPHNLGEVIDGTLALIDNPDLEIADLIQYIPGPDFPTGAQIMGRSGIGSAYTTGKGSVVMRACVGQEEMSAGRTRLVVTEIPYQVNKSRLLERIGDLVRDKIIETISDIRDESSREGVRVVVELKKDTNPEVVLAQLYKHTPLQTSFGCNILALNKGRPLQLNLKDILNAFIEFREEVISRRSAFELNKARDRAHVLCGLAIAVANIDDVIALIRGAKDPEEAKQGLMSKDWKTSDIGVLLQRVEDLDDVPTVYKLTEAQAKAILELRLQRLTGLERDKISDELDELVAKIADLLEILGNREVMLDVMREGLREIKEKYATPRRTQIEDAELDQDIEDLIAREDMVVTVSYRGYIKRVPLSTYRTQKRGGKGRSGMTTREEDFVDRIFVANTHTPVLFFTSKGMVHQMKVYKLPIGSPTSLGKPMINLLPLDKDETISTVMPLPDDEETWENLYVMFTTSGGSVRRNKLSEFTNIRSNGKIAMKLEGDEELIAVHPCRADQDILLASRQGKAIRFKTEAVRVFQSRNSTGVRGMKLGKDDRIVSMSVLESDKEQFIMTVSANGYAKRTSSEEYRVIGRGGQGVANMSLTSKTGEVVRSVQIEDEDEVMLVSNGGTLIRCPVRNVRIAGRSTQGVILFKTDDGEEVVSVARLVDRDDEEDESQEESEDQASTSAEADVEASQAASSPDEQETE